MSEPGFITAPELLSQAPGQLDTATWELALSLFDTDTKLWLSPSLASDEAIITNLRFHCQMTLVEQPDEADFVLASHIDLPSLQQLNQGTPEYPDRSTTLIIQVPVISGEPDWQLSGPGIPDTRNLRLGGLPAIFRKELINSRSMFPLGVDCIFCCATQVVAIPRSTRISQGSY